MWTGAILAGGRSRRLGGRNKAALRIGDDTVLDRQLSKLRRVVDRTIIVADDSALFAWTGLPVVRDLAPGEGALGALRTAIHTAGNDRTLVIACDMPFVSDGLLRYLVDAGREADIAIPRTARGYEPLCATYSRRCGEKIEQLIQDRRYKLSDVALIPGLIIREVGADELARFGPEELLFFNINTPDDYARAIDLDANS
jgi:molybdopterin-guanine dinucleotide biosynthesis protein A